MYDMILFIHMKKNVEGILKASQLKSRISVQQQSVFAHVTSSDICKLKQNKEFSWHDQLARESFIEISNFAYRTAGRIAEYGPLIYPITVCTLSETYNNVLRCYLQELFFLLNSQSLFSPQQFVDRHLRLSVVLERIRTKAEREVTPFIARLRV